VAKQVQGCRLTARCIRFDNATNRGLLKFGLASGDTSGISLEDLAQHLSGVCAVDSSNLRGRLLLRPVAPLKEVATMDQILAPSDCAAVLRHVLQDFVNRVEAEPARTPADAVKLHLDVKPGAHVPTTLRLPDRSSSWKSMAQDAQRTRLSPWQPAAMAMTLPLATLPPTTLSSSAPSRSRHWRNSRQCRG
jgi:hypothetical protein